MHLLRIIHTIKPSSGGPAQGLRNLLPELEALGWTNEVVCMDRPEEVATWADPFPVHALGPVTGKWSGYWRLVRWLESQWQRFDAVIVHGLWLYPSAAAWKVHSGLASFDGQGKTPYFIYPHGMLDPWFQHAPERRLKAWRNTLYWHLIERRVVRQAQGLLFTCQQELELARRTFWGYRPNNELNVGYGIAAPPSRSGEQQQSFTQICPELNQRSWLLSLGRIHPKKGLDHLIQGYLAACERCSEADSRPVPALVVAGPMEGPYASHLRQLAQQGVRRMEKSGKVPTPVILFPGMLQGDAKWGALHGCEAFVLPSHQENFGIAVVEALACGKPVVISDQVNIWKEVAADDAGWVGQPSTASVAHLLEAWFKLAEAERLAAGRAAIRCFSTRFTVQAAADRFMKVIETKLSAPELAPIC
jgi:glycosyltransferase involved in cell wall biosynthesis